ncbi:pyrimidine 5'-nucleotidase [Geoalkalibacter sp.]|uniref:pyrimidine 5'-nucleotidase n=1 Tax=Geoalkalibacter sp. TaxID=3041440 RepID=UPI00272E4EE4|nr:pyrimidine 5'-nucleotidase [Geoalkalibacter sp.]
MDVIIFDLDNTLYAPERELFSLIDVRINRYMREVVGIAASEVDGLRRAYWAKYGVTLGGLMRHYGVDPEDYLEYVHDVDVHSRLVPDPELRAALQALEGTKVVFTNGSRGHAERVLGALGLADQFSAIFDIRVADYRPKPYVDPYQAVLRRLGVEGARCVMVEDSPTNLETAKTLGMRTVLVGDALRAPYVDACVARAEQAAQLIGGWQ